METVQQILSFKSKLIVKLKVFSRLLSTYQVMYLFLHIHDFLFLLKILISERLDELLSSQRCVDLLLQLVYGRFSLKLNFKLEVWLALIEKLRHFKGNKKNFCLLWEK